MRKISTIVGCVVVMGLVAPEARAQAQTPVLFNLEAQDLDRALTAVGLLTGRDIIIAADVARGKRAGPLIGRLTADEAIKRLLAGSGLIAEYRPDAVLVTLPVVGAAQGVATTAITDVVVVGTRLRDTTSPSPLLVIDRRALRASGKADLGDVARTLPQNFNGGQNPEVGVGAPGANQNIDASSGLNLRGLGADATLTLLNGQRLAYDGVEQSVDLSSIPLAAVERIDIVPDGASSIYGSDAVGGVANVVLRRDVSGLDATARVDVPTNGGGVQQRYTATGGAGWSSGSALATYNFDRNEAITAGERRVTRALAPSATLLREQRHHAALVSVQQSIGTMVRLEVDGLYSSRWSYGETPYDAIGSAQQFGNTNRSDTRALSIAPRLIADIGLWRATVQGVYSDNRVRYNTIGYADNATASRYQGCLCNTLTSLEAGLEGGLFDVPGGTARLAIGAGVRAARLHYRQDGSLGEIDFARTRTTHFGYGEASLPLVSARNATPGVQRLALSIAGRFEHYAGARGVLSPKLGAIWQPVDGIEAKVSWGRSFKAPTLYQQYSPGLLTVLNAEDLGYAGYPSGATVGIINGGNNALQPERARSWSATLDIQPPTIPGARLVASYFDVVFKGRVQVPVQSFFNALDNPAYADFIIVSPTPAQVASVLAAASGGLDNATGRPFDATALIAILDAGNRNVSRETASGIDLAASYSLDVSAGRSASFSIDASYLTSRRIVIPSTPVVQLAGTLFNPPRLRMRGGIGWLDDRVSVSAFVNRVGGVTDNRMEQSLRVGGQTTIDLTLRIGLGAGGLQGGTELAVAVSNLFDAMPTAIATSYAFATPYDSTNYSVIGRTIGVQLSRRF